MATRGAKPKRDGARRRAGRRVRPDGLHERLQGKRVCICLGAGGVGKTTTSAAIALGLAARGKKVAVVTIDPAARLASALGLERLSGEPTQIERELLEAQGVHSEGQLWAMMLDSKGTFDDIVTRLASDDAEREEILANPIYRELSTAVAGSQELSAVAKLYELRHERDFDVIVLDTPPSRNAIDFLETPRRLLGFLEGRALRVFLSPGGLAARLFGRSTALVFAIFARVTGVDMLKDLSAFFRSLSGILEAFGERTRGVNELLRDPTTSFMIVTSPEPEPAREAPFLARLLADRKMTLGGLIVNRVHFDGLGEQSVEQVRDLLVSDLGERLAQRVAGNLADFDVLVRRDRRTIARLSEELSEPAPILVPHLDEEIRDLAGLGRLAEHLFDGQEAVRRRARSSAERAGAAQAGQLS
ncbi:MAG TPA: ArsA-related P-loop ATPase [Solirubrobacteraceae bacterium]|nr:ArsA-related P-loop ATPase [Solirubrobacteraceae bacterium]